LGVRKREPLRHHGEGIESGIDHLGGGRASGWYCFHDRPFLHNDISK
jgi:hypothetical protein